MSFGYDVEVSVGAEIRFPPTCAICGTPVADESIPIQGSPSGFFGMWKWQFGLNKELLIPAHPDCGRSLRRSYIARQLVLLAIAIPLVVAAIVYEIGRLEFLAILVVAITPPILWQIHNPLKVEFTTEDDLHKFTFKDLGFAEQFAQLNSAKVVREDV